MIYLTFDRPVAETIYVYLWGRQCNSMPLGAAWAYYGKVLVLANVAS